MYYPPTPVHPACYDWKALPSSNHMRGIFYQNPRSVGFPKIPQFLEFTPVQNNGCWRDLWVQNSIRKPKICYKMRYRGHASFQGCAGCCRYDWRRDPQKLSTLRGDLILTMAGVEKKDVPVVIHSPPEVRIWDPSLITEAGYWNVVFDVTINCRLGLVFTAPQNFNVE